MSDAEVVAALANDGKLVKRPVVIPHATALVSFDEAASAATFG